MKILAGEKLRKIALRAGKASSIMNQELVVLGPEHAEELLAMVLGSGAPATTKGHVSTWERMEDWLSENNWSGQIYPLTLAPYVLYLNKNGFGPAAVPALRGSTAWISRKLGMQAPDIKSSYLIAIEKQIF